MRRTPSGDGFDDDSPIGILRNALLTGLAVVVPLVISVYLLWVVIGWFGQTLRPFVEFLELSGIVGFIEQRGLIVLLLEFGIYDDVIGLISEFIAGVMFATIVLAVGFLARYRYGEWILHNFDYAVSSIPGIGTVYQSFRRVGRLLLETDAEDFEGVKLVELLHDETYVIAFETSQSARVADATDHDRIQTVFVPMAPNPVTGGFLAFVPEDRVIDVDMTVDEGIQAILTSGIATDRRERPNVATLDDVPSFGDWMSDSHPESEAEPDPDSTGGS